MKDSNGNIGEELSKLLLLQELDVKIFDIRSELEEFPLRETEIDRSIELKRNGMQEAESCLKALQVARNEKETDIQAKETKIKKYQADLYGIKNNKEFQSLQQEISGMKADISVIEDELLELFDRIESAKALVETERKKFEDEKKLSDGEKETIRSAAKKMSSELDAFAQKRAELAAGVAPPVLLQYQKILDKWGRTAVTEIVGEFCGECNMHLRPQIIDEAKMAKRIVLCENCSRILHVKN